MNANSAVKSETEVNLINALREFERAHRAWMNTNVFTEEGARAKYERDCARDQYAKAVKAVHPNWGV